MSKLNLSHFNILCIFSIVLISAIVSGQESLPERIDLDALLTKGDELFSKMNYTTPTGKSNNALSIYKQVLELDSDNDIALKRIGIMEAYYIKKASQAEAESDSVKREEYCKKILLVNPHNKMARDTLGLKSAPTANSESTAATGEEQKKFTEDKQARPFFLADRLRLERYKTYPGNILQIFEEADEFYFQRNSEDQTPANNALKKYENILSLEPDNYDALWQASRILLWIGDHSPEEEQVEIYQKGMDYGKKAIDLYPEGIEAHYWYGSNIARYGSARGIFKSLQYISPLVEVMEKLIKLDPQHHKAYMVLGIIYQQAPPWPVSVGDLDKSEEYLKRAISIYPHSLHSQLELGITYNKMKKWDLAKIQFKKVIDMPFEEEYTPENKEYKEEAKEILMMMKRRGL